MMRSTQLSKISFIHDHLLGSPYILILYPVCIAQLYHSVQTALDLTTIREAFAFLPTLPLSEFGFLYKAAFHDAVALHHS